MFIEDKKFRIKAMLSIHKDAVLSFSELTNDKVLESTKQQMRDEICRQLWIHIAQIQKGQADLHFMITLEE